MPTFDKYREMVKEALIKTCDYKKQLEVEEYFNSKEVQDLIRRRYEIDIQQLMNREITEEVFNNGCVYSVVYCLSLMME